MTARNHGTFFFAPLLPIIKSLSSNTKARFAVSVVEILSENIHLTEMLSSLKVAKEYLHIYCFHGKHFTCCPVSGEKKFASAQSMVDKNLMPPKNHDPQK